jgi:hypothetical protein
VTPNTVAVKGIKELRRKLTTYSVRVADMAPMWAEVAAGVAQAEAEWFASSGGGTWKPLTQEYAERKAAEFPGRPILIATGELQDSLVNPARAMRLEGPAIMRWVATVVTPKGDWNLAALHRDGTPKMDARDPTIPAGRSIEIALAAARVHAAWV